MFRILAVFLAMMVFAGCNKQAGDQQQQQQQPQQPMTTTQQDMNQSSAPKQDVTDATMLKLDPGMEVYIDKVKEARAAYDKTPNDMTKATLVKAYNAFGDYMQYQSPVSPRAGKYHRALMEYKHALALDPHNEKATKEATQIENVYRSMGRPIPNS